MSEGNALVLVFHPAELLDRPADRLCAFSWSAFGRNLDIITAIVRESGAEPAFRRLSEALA